MGDGKSVEWTEKYRPRTLDDVVGNKKAIQSLLTWARSWDSGKVPKKRAVILSGKPGCGKTTVAHALAADFGWGVIELNASDTRNADAIRRVATAGALNQTFTDDGEFLRSDTGGRKLIILDEADHLHGNVDRGGVKTILETIRKTQQPIILIVNDLYQLTRHSSSFKTLTQTIRFQGVGARSIKPVLRRIAAAEHMEVDDQALEVIAERTSGDLRSAINDLQALSLGRSYVGEDDVDAVGKRDTRVTMYDAVRTILKSDNVRAARRAAQEIDEDPEFLLLWLSENVPNEYKELPDLARGMEAVARADLFLNRARRTQNYRMWAYASDLMSAGVATAKDREYRFYTQYRFPLWLATMGRTRAMRQTKASLSRKLRTHCHTSDSIARDELIPFYRMMFELDGGFAVDQTYRLDLQEAEVAMLLGDSRDGKRVSMLMEAVEARADGTGHIDPAGLGFSVFEREPEVGDDDGDDDGDDESEGETGKGDASDADPEDADSQKSLFEF
ncbi:MAG: replication factor C large subunit [Thermoplasmata archaeon]|nr:MAG: replication factor C large subunit [Thermoplasmata archaeon]